MLDYWKGKNDMTSEDEGELVYLNPTERLFNVEGRRGRDCGCR